jgi:hypothetical protein
MPTFNEIQTEILEAKAQVAEFDALEVLTDSEIQSLDDVDSASKVANWRLWVWVVSFASFTLHSFFAIFKAEITAIVKANRPHGTDWYKQKALAFQYGHEIINDDEYAEIDEAAKLIKQCAVEEGDRKVRVKIATLDGGNLVKIEDEDVMDAFTEYMRRVKDAGTRLEIVNRDADELKLVMDVYYDPTLMKSNGELILLPGVYPVYNPGDTTNADGNYDALQIYLRSLDFNGNYVITKAIDHIQRAIGVVDVELTYAGFKAGISTEFLQFTRFYKPNAGYMKLEDITINYINV